MTTSLDEEISKKVIRQVEFYFSDSNLPRDYFLRKTIGESEDGLVSLALICSFSKMRGHLSLGEAKPEDISEETLMAVANTLRTSGFLKVSEDGMKVGRATELAKPEELIEQLDNRTVAASPLPYDVTREAIESFFGQLAKVNSVRLPTHVSAKKVFCGTALIEFSTEDNAQMVLEQTLLYDGASLELRPKKYFDEERKMQMQQVNSTKSGADCKDSEEADYPKGLVVAFTLKKKQSGAKENGSHQSTKPDAHSSKPDGGECEAVTSPGSDNVSGNDNGLDEVAEEDMKQKVNVESGPECDVEEAKDDKKSSEAIDVKDGGKPAQKEKPTAAACKNDANVVLREDLKAIFEKFGTVKYVDFTMGAESGFIRFEEPEAAQKSRAVAVLSDVGGLIVKNYIAVLEPVTGEAEKEYWKFRESTQHNKGRGSKHHKGGKRGWSRGNKDSPSGRPNKFQKFGHNKH
ncbi:La protein 1-like protein [Drosera capensis]